MAALVDFPAERENPADHEMGWRADGMPSPALLGNAIQVWSMLQARPTTVGEAALAFALTPEQIAAAVDWHAWMFLSGPGPGARLPDQLIEHEGE